jgi:hypothetical protein
VPDPPASGATRVSLPPLAWAGLIVFAVLMLATLGVQLALIEDQRSTTDRQLRTAVRQANATLPLIQDARPLVEQLHTSAPALRRFGRETAALVHDARPAVADVRQLSEMLLRSDLPRLTDEVVRADLPRLVERVDALTGELLRQDRLQRLLVRSNGVLGEVRALHTVPKVTEAAELAPEAVGLLRRSLAVQEEVLAQTREILAVARETERHAESLDAKTGGPTLVPPSGG